MALRSLHSQLVARLRAQEPRSAIKRNARNDPELAKISGEVQEFCVCKGSKEVNSRDFVNASMQGLDMLSFHCMQGLKRCNVHIRAQKFSNFQGSCGACKGSKCCNFQWLNILQFSGFSACKGSKCFNFQGFVHARVKMQLFRESLCMQELKVLQFPGSCDFQGFAHAIHILLFPGILCMLELDVLRFRGLWLCTLKGSKCCSKCFTFQGFCARKGSTCFNFQKLWHTRISNVVNPRFCAWKGSIQTS